MLKLEVLLIELVVISEGKSGIDLYIKRALHSSVGCRGRGANVLSVMQLGCVATGYVSALWSWI